jgi:DNA-binding transcriptional MerR regulator
MKPTPPGKLTLGQLCRATGLARASLLHYEALGLLAPAARTAAGYRLYGKDEIERLRTIRRYRDAGLSLAAIRDLLASPGKPSPQAGPHALLEGRLMALCEEVERLREQQRTLARLLAAPEFRCGHPCQGKEAWVALLRQAGFSDEDMGRWHADFERESPEGHAAFLESLGLAAAEIEEIRRWSRNGPAS